MKSIQLPYSDISTSALGFGCAYLTGGWELRRSRRLVDAAFDVGFRHFDVAPLYGIGTAEDVLGVAMLGRRDRVTIASKVGRPRPKLTLRTQMARLLATPVRRYAPSILRNQESKQAASISLPSIFEISFVRSSLEDTLRRLRTDYLDFFFLHEATIDDISEELLYFLDRKRREGVIRAVGAASTFDKLKAIAALHGNFFDAFQYSWSALDFDQSFFCPKAFHLTHRAIMRAFVPMRAWCLRDSVFAKRISVAIGMDVTVDSILANVLLGAALAHNSQGITLVGTRRIDRIIANAKVLDDDVYIRAGHLLIDALNAEVIRPISV